MKKDNPAIELCADIIEFVTKKLLSITESESESLKVVKIGSSRAINENKK